MRVRGRERCWFVFHRAFAIDDTWSGESRGAMTRWRMAKNKEVNLFLSRKPKVRSQISRGYSGKGKPKKRFVHLMKTFLFLASNTVQEFAQTFDMFTSLPGMFDTCVRNIWSSKATKEELLGCMYTTEIVKLIFFLFVIVRLRRELNVLTYDFICNFFSLNLSKSVF